MLIENATPVSQQIYGEFQPHCDQKTHGATWAVVEGRQVGGFKTVRELESQGKPVGTDGKYSVPHKAFKYADGAEKGKTHDIQYNGMVLREMVATNEDLEAATKYEGGLSAQSLQQFEALERVKDRESNNIRTGSVHETKLQELQLNNE